MTNRNNHVAYHDIGIWEQTRKNTAQEIVRRIVWTPSCIFIIGTGFLTLLVTFYFVWLGVTWTGIRYNVAFHRDYLEIVEPGLEAEKAWSFLRPGDKIVAVDDIPIKQLFSDATSQEKDALKLKFLPLQSNGSELSLVGLAHYQNLRPKSEVSSTNEATVYLLYGTQAQTLILDTNRRLMTPQNLPTSDETGNNWRSSIELTGNGLVKVNVRELKGSFNRLGITLVALLIVLSYVGLSLALFVLRPSLLTCVFAINNYIFTLWCSSTNSSDGYLDSFQIIVLFVAAGLHGVLTLHFILLFPDGVRLGRRVKLGLASAYLLCAALVAARVATIFLPALDNDGILLQSAYSLERGLRRTSVLITISLLAIAMTLLLIKFWRSRGERRVRLKLAVLSIFAAAIIPQGAGLYYVVVSTWQPVVYDNFVLFFAATLIAPFGFGYAVLKNQLLGISLTLRRSLVHVFISLLVIVSYLLLSVIIAIFLPDLRELNKEPIFVSLLLCILVLGLYRLRDKVQHLIDRLFKIDILEYPLLTRRWHNHLSQTTDLADLLRRVLKDLPYDYHYSSVGLLAVEPHLIEVIERSFYQVQEESNFEPTVPVETKEYRKAWLIEPSLTNASAQHRLNDIDIDGTLKDGLGFRKLNVPCSSLIKSPRLLYELEPESVEGGLDKYLLALPLNVEQVFYGLLLLGSKQADYLPSEEELEHLNAISGQIAIGLANSLALEQALHLAHTQKRLRELYQQILNREEIAREEERAQVADAIHADVLQYLNLVYRNLQEQSIQEQSSLPMQSRTEDVVMSNPQMLRKAISLLYEVIRDLSPLHIKQNFVSELVNLFGEYRREYPTITFDLQIRGERSLIEGLLRDELKMSLYRIIQEACRNALKHAVPQTVIAWLHLEQAELEGEEPDADYYHLEVGVRDDGRGISTASSTQFHHTEIEQGDADKESNGGFGLEMIKRQVERQQGELEVISQAGQGTQIICSFLLQIHAKEKSRDGSGRNYPTFDELLGSVPADSWVSRS